MNKALYGVAAITRLLSSCMGITGKTKVGMKALCQWKGSGMLAPR